MILAPLVTLAPVSAVWNVTRHEWVLGNGPSYDASFNFDGQVLAFTTEATNLYPGDRDFMPDIVLRVVGADANTPLLDDASPVSHSHPIFAPDQNLLVFRSTGTSVGGVISDALADIFLASFSINPARQITDITVLELTSGADAIPLDFDGSRVLFRSPRNLDGSPHPGVEGLFIVAPGEQPQRVVAANQPIGQARFVPGGAIAFDTAASVIDLNRDGTDDVPGADTNDRSDTFLVRRFGTLFASVEQLAVPGQNGSRIADGADGSFDIDLLLVADLSAAGGVTNSLLGVSISGRVNPDFVVLPSPNVGAALEATGLATSDGQRVRWYADPGLPAGELLSPGLSPGNAANGQNANPAVAAERLGAELSILAPGVVGSTAAPIVFESTATDLGYTVPVARTGSEARQIVLATSSVQPRADLLIDYTPGARLNPLNAAGLPTVETVVVDVENNQLQEWADGSYTQLIYSGSLSDRLGRVHSPSDSVLLVGNVGFIARSLSARDDIFTVSDSDVGFQGLRGAIFAGDGLDTVLVPAGRSLTLTALLNGFEQLVFDPAARPGTTTEITIRLNSAGGVVLPFGTFIGSPGHDRLVFAPFDINWVLDAPAELDLRAQFLEMAGEIEVENWVGHVIAAPAGVTVTAGGSDNGEYAVTLTGGTGRDELRAGSGLDSLAGGDGIDTLSYVYSPEAVTVDLSSGTLSGGWAAGDRMSGVEAVVGSQYADTLTGSGGDDRLEGGAGDDELSARDGHDTLLGQGGLDTAVFARASQTYAITLGAGADEVRVESILVGAPAMVTLLRGVELLRFANETITLAKLTGMPMAVFDYGIGGALNPAPGGSPQVTRIEFDAIAGVVVEQGPGGTQARNLADVLGRAYPHPLFPNEPLLLLPPESGSASLGPGDDMLVGDPVRMARGLLASEAFVDGGDGVDTLLARAGFDNAWSLAALWSIEEYRFDPAAAPAQGTTLRLIMDDTGAVSETPVARVLGSPGRDTLAFDNTETSTGALNLNSLVFTDFEPSDRVEVRFTQAQRSFVSAFNLPANLGVHGTPGVDVVDSGPGNDAIRGEAGDDHVGSGAGNDTVEGGPGHDIVDGGTGADLLTGGAGNDSLSGGELVPSPGQDDVAVFSGRLSDYALLGSAAASSPRFTADIGLRDLRAGAPDGDDRAVGIEVFRFADGDRTLAELQALAGGAVLKVVTVAASGHIAVVTEGSGGGAGRFQVRLERSGDLGLPLEGTFILQPGGSGGASANDVRDGFGWPLPFRFAAASATTTVFFDAKPDALHEDSEGLLFVLQAVVGGSIGSPASLGLTIIDDDPLAITAVGPARSDEGSDWTLYVTENDDRGALANWRINWGDGNAQTLSAGDVAFLGGYIRHTYADGDYPVGTPYTVTVHALETSGGTIAIATRGVTVDDVAPTMVVGGAPSTLTGHPYVLEIRSGITDRGINDVPIAVRIDWGDGGSATVIPVASLADHYDHSFTDVGSVVVRVYVTNPEGEFLVGAVPVAVSAATGDAAGQTPGQLAAAWLDPSFDMLHTALLDDAPAWSAPSFSTVGGNHLPGGDLFILGGLGLLGVSGRSAATSEIAQEIDGQEALRIDLLGAEPAGALWLELALLFTDDDPTLPGIHESMRVQLYRGSELVQTSTHRASDEQGALTLWIAGAVPFDQVVLTAGATNGAGQFVFGALADAQGVAATTPAGVGSDFMLGSLVFIGVAEAEAMFNVDTPFGG